MRNEFSFVWVLRFSCWSKWLAVYLADLKNKARYINEQVEKYWGKSMWGLPERYHVGWLDCRAGTPELMPCGAGSGQGHEPHGMECVSPGDTMSVAFHLQAIHCWEPAQPGTTNWKGSLGNHFRGQSIYNLSCKETTEQVTLSGSNWDEQFQTRCLTLHTRVIWHAGSCSDLLPLTDVQQHNSRVKP